MPVPNSSFGTATSAIPLSQLDANFATPITIGNTAVQLGNTVTTLNNMTLANVTISSGTITITNVSVTTANVSGTANVSTLVVVGNATVGGNTTITGNITAANANVTSNLVLFGGTANGVAYLNTSKVLTTGSALVFDGTNLGVGTATPDIFSRGYGRIVGINDSGSSGAALEINSASSYPAIELGRGGVRKAFFTAQSTVTEFGNLEAVPLSFFTNSAERARIDSSGNFLVGKTALGLAVGTSIDANTSTGSGVRVVSSASTSNADGFQMYSTGAGAYRFYVSFDGTISATSAVITPITSDERLKQNIVDYSNGLSQVLGLRPRYFEYKKEPGRKLAGFISQEVQTVMPEAIVPTREDPEMMTYSIDWYPLFVKAIQEQQTLITTLTARITALEGA
jgi:trimeric autotransporter adhesin